MAVTKKSINAKAVASGADATGADAPNGWVEGIANAFEVDRYDELVLPAAMQAAFTKYLANPILSFGHGIDGNPTNGTLPAGKVLWLKILDMPMDLGNGVMAPAGSTYFRAAFAPTDDAQKVRSLYAGQFMRGFSVQFITQASRDPLPQELEKFPGLRRVITELDLIEIACAVVPVNAGSLAAASKSLNGKGGLKPPRRIPTTKEKAMGNMLLTSEHKDLIAAAHKAYGDHAEKMEELSKSLGDMGAAADAGEEGDHAATAAKCSKDMEAVTESHNNLQGAVGAMKKAISGDDDNADEPADDEPADDEPNDEAGSPPMDDPEARAVSAAWDKAIK